MLFNSYLFILLFLPITWMVYTSLNHFKLVDLSKSWLLGASLFYYSYWNLTYLPLILISILTNFSITNQLLDEKASNRKKPLFYAGLIFNLGLLGYFKYTNFFLDNLGAITGKEYDLIRVALPVGISFYTLGQIAYLVDVYQGISRERKLLDYALFVVFFPYLLAGPITHYDHMHPQFQSMRTKLFNRKNVSLGLFLFVIGLFKKVMIADTLSFWVNDGYREAETLHFLAAWGTSLSYTLQLYFDFSGYTDMAVGVALLFNFKIPQNFNSPLRSGNINEFWARWHMTLSTYIRTYIFTPLVRLMPKSTFHYSMIAMALAMTIAGIWHGAAWTYVIYGMIHGLAIVAHYYWKKRKKKLPYLLGWFITFNFVNLSFVLFRANSLKQAGFMFKGMMGLQGFQLPKMGIKFLANMGVKMGPYMTNDQNLHLALVLAGFLIIFKAKNSLEWENDFKPTPALAVGTGMLFVLCLFGLNRVSEFIYFNF